MLQNRVDPSGQLHAVSDRGALMGNRGILHNAENQIIRPWAHKSWVTCLLSYKNIKRSKPFSAGNYSELFFLDEATAFAAGHRPCSYCQRERSKLFKAAWLNANAPCTEHSDISMPKLDAQLHKERSLRGGTKITYQESAGTLPKGAMFAHNGSFFLASENGYLPWTFSGYGSAIDLSPTTSVSVLTPKSIVAAFTHGFQPYLHPSASV
ncbi:hypothetical protein [Pseudomonas aeruginosa]|uniref:hypothetical protein n=1 Tax=Pseudomonas aeruginosa TaxID=287 RepID=UPI001D0AEC1A|nr:hypothetical protein [Pseudomonas aeruginosa]MCC0119717.1 hypothetical protein [Pseudomonas aeruginosa]MCC0316428.1 hypothetical protein [Pseudomonas aeruginosa]MCC0366805.1 hypothetical protein [Pseudomonas aeruginosa]MCC0429926.1 hypothetical protein [Pseudomonas aeruginosa]MCC0511248.1 hypothetical protein [Pseudomonas aeruginosa]